MTDRRTVLITFLAALCLPACASHSGATGGLATRALLDAWRDAPASCETVTALPNGARISETSSGCQADAAGTNAEIGMSLVVRPEPADEPLGLEGISAIVVTLALEGDQRDAFGDRVGVRRHALEHGFQIDAVVGPDGVGWRARLPPDASAALLERAALALTRLAAEPSFSSNYLATWAERNRAAAPQASDLPELWAIALAAGQGRLIAPPALGGTIALLNREDLVRHHRRLFTAPRIRLRLPATPRGAAVPDALAALLATPASAGDASRCAAPPGRLFVVASPSASPTWLAVPLPSPVASHGGPLGGPLVEPAALRALITALTRDGSPLRAKVVRVGDTEVFAIAEPDLAPLLAFIDALRRVPVTAMPVSPEVLTASEALIRAVANGVAVRTVEPDAAGTTGLRDARHLEGAACAEPDR